MVATLVSLVRVVLYLALTAFCIPVQALLVAADSPLQVGFARGYHRLCCRIVGFAVVVRGALSLTKPTLFISNHCGYLDIMVLGSIVPGSFVAKHEVEAWPLFGLLARLQRTVFVERRRSGAAVQHAEIGRRLLAGDNLILFPEGTSSDGNRVLPFKTALFGVANLRIDDRPLTLQPVSIAYSRLDGLPLGRSLRPFYAWYGDMAMLSHVWRAFGLGRATVEVRLHPTVTLEGFGSRKALAAECHRTVAAGVAGTLSGRDSSEAEPSPDADDDADWAEQPGAPDIAYS